MIELYDIVSLERKLSGTNVPLGCKGTVLLIHRNPSPACEVEFFDELGGYLGVFSVPTASLRLVKGHRA